MMVVYILGALLAGLGMLASGQLKKNLQNILKFNCKME